MTQPEHGDRTTLPWFRCYVSVFFFFNLSLSLVILGLTLRVNKSRSQEKRKGALLFLFQIVSNNVLGADVSIAGSVGVLHPLRRYCYGNARKFNTRGT